jgi:hypothetical protein
VKKRLYLDGKEERKMNVDSGEGAKTLGERLLAEVEVEDLSSVRKTGSQLMAGREN